MINEIMNIEFDYMVDTTNLSTFRIKGKVKGVFYPKNEQEFINIYRFLTNNALPFEVIGNGSNILFSNKSKDILIISTKKLKQTIKINKENVIASASTPLNKIFLSCYKNGLSGFEQLASIPATVGGALKMNAGAFGRSIFDILEKVKICKDDKVLNLRKDQLHFGYRMTDLHDCIILSAKFKLIKENKCNIYKNYIFCLNARREKQPVGQSIGSIFKNPERYSAGFLIEECGLKGLKHNDAMISDKHANIIINTANATYDDIIYLIELCKKSVKEKFNIDLETEIKII